MIHTYTNGEATSVNRPCTRRHIFFIRCEKWLILPHLTESVCQTRFMSALHNSPGDQGVHTRKSITAHWAKAKCGENCWILCIHNCHYCVLFISTTTLYSAIMLINNTIQKGLLFFFGGGGQLPLISIVISFEIKCGHKWKPNLKAPLNCLVPRLRATSVILYKPLCCYVIVFQSPVSECLQHRRLFWNWGASLKLHEHDGQTFVKVPL